MPESPSYSMMYGLPGGFSITMFSGTHKLKPKNTIHRDCGVRVTLAENMCIIWHEGTVHAGSRSRLDDDGKLRRDLRFFSYIWRGGVGRKHGVITANGENVYRKCKICCDVAGTGRRGYSCDICRGVEYVDLDLSQIPAKSYDPGAVIKGDLKKLGWVVVRGVSHKRGSVSEDRKAIKEMIEISYKHEKWNEIDNNRGRFMSYNHDSEVSSDWNSAEIQLFFTEIRKKIFRRQFDYHDYILGKYNLICNLREMEKDQLPHTDYPARSLNLR